MRKKVVSSNVLKCHVNPYGVDYKKMGMVLDNMLDYIPNDYYKKLQLGNMKYSLKKGQYSLDSLVETLRCLTEGKRNRFNSLFSLIIKVEHKRLKERQQILYSSLPKKGI
ncbi:hypothetical protein ABC382_00320 [Lysinibacillus sp. 1P01SD]|uniref:hypothetical protein n=1 Tax=Lysinibacillus sp. 1P01SD TaxID=3132285 RepID=UPI00399F1899